MMLYGYNQARYGRAASGYFFLSTTTDQTVMILKTVPVKLKKSMIVSYECLPRRRRAEALPPRGPGIPWSSSAFYISGVFRRTFKEEPVARHGLPVRALQRICVLTLPNVLTITAIDINAPPIPRSPPAWRRRRSSSIPSPRRPEAGRDTPSGPGYSKSTPRCR